jgi:drug/metabolite transporter (DMT)-like permease
MGVFCGLAAGAWLGAAEAPTKLVQTGISPFVITLGMVSGVFVARWTVPMLLKGSGFLFEDLKQNAHLIIWALLAGMLWVVANTLTVFAIRDVGLAIAFPLWNTNSLVGILWGWLFFNELRGAGKKGWVKVLGGAAAIVAGTSMLAYTSTQANAADHYRAIQGICAALGAGILWGTQYIPYRKAYISGMNPLSFVTMIACGELIAAVALGAFFQGGFVPLFSHLAAARTVLFWLFLGGFCWVFGDLFQQYAAKYIGIGRGIPLSNTNQLWGMAWGALVFGEFSNLSASPIITVVTGSLIMIAGAAAISLASASSSELTSWTAAMNRECSRYSLDPLRVARSVAGDHDLNHRGRTGRRWEILALLGVLAVLVSLALIAHYPAIAVNTAWMFILIAAALLLLGASGTLLWRRTRFS